MTEPLVKSSVATDLILSLEKLAFRTWPAETALPLGDWEMRATGGVTKRANSVFTAGPIPVDTNWLGHVNDFYASRGLPVCFHVSAAAPPELDPILDRNGFEKIFPTNMMTASGEEVLRILGALGSSRLRVRRFDQATDEWLEPFMQMEQFGPGRRDAYRTIFGGIRSAKTFQLVELEGEPVGAGTAVCEDGWAGFVNIVTKPSFRRQGIGREIVRSLASWSAENGAHSLYLQVLADNAPARALYESCGYSHLYSYHYRIQA